MDITKWRPRIKPLAGRVNGSSTATDWAAPKGNLIIIDEMHEHIDDKKFSAMCNAHKVKC